MTSFNDLEMGAFDTPKHLSKFFIKEFNLFDKWLNGSSVFDPTMGEGNLLVSLIEYGIEKGYSIKDLPIQNLYGNELNTQRYNKAIENLSKYIDINNRFLTTNFTNKDIFELETNKKFDIIFGNPPFVNFNDLNEEYKNKIKEHFTNLGLVKNKKDVLLGNSRVDVASAVILKCIKDFLSDYGNLYFFIPMSIFLNDGANKNFRTYQIDGIDFKLNVLYDLNLKIKDKNLLFNVDTRYGFVHITKNMPTEFPIEYKIFIKKELKSDSFESKKAKPLIEKTDFLSIFDKDVDFNIDRLKINKENKPRQGINTCGANDIFIFDSYDIYDENNVVVSNKKIKKTIILPHKFIFPLLTSQNFNGNNNAKKWVLLPYNTDGTVLSMEELKKHENLYQYFVENKDRLINRKGVLLKSILNKKNIWWALLGVSKYNFYPYKIVWESFGKKEFKPMLFDSKWQANQSLQSYIAVKNKEEALKILDYLNSENTKKYISSYLSEGTMNFAQPGRIKNLFKISLLIRIPN